MQDQICNQSVATATLGSQHDTMADLEIRNAAEKQLWTREKVILLLREAAIDNICHYRMAYSRASSLPTMARRLFGSFAKACQEAGLKSANEARPRYSICQIFDCEVGVRSSGIPYCEKHYMRLLRYGRTGLHQPPEVIMHTHGYLMAYAPEHSLAKKRGASREYQHRIVYYDHHGEGPFRCHWCSKVVGWNNMHVDHVNSIKHDNSMTNLVASCPKCNTWRDKDKVLKAHRNKVGRYLTSNGITKNISEWANHIGISHAALDFRLKQG